MSNSSDIENTAQSQKSSRHFRIWFIIAAVAFVLLIILPDFIYWAFLSHFQEPLRADLGPYTNYLAWLHDIFQRRFSDNPYFWEHSGGTERFILFQSIVRLVPYATRIPMGWWYTILKGASALTLFIGFYFLLKNFGRKHWESLGLTTFFFFFYGPFKLLEPGAASWFLVFFIVGIILLFRLPQFSKFWHQVIGIGIANILFAIHPVFFSLGVVIGGLWLLGLSILNRNRRHWSLVVLWGLFSLINVKIFYSTSISGVSQANSLRESLVHMGVYFSRLPYVPLSSLRLAFAFIALAVLTYIILKKFSGESRLFKTSLFLSISFISIFLGINSNIVTGFAVVPDHYLIPEDFFAAILLGFILFEQLPEAGRSRFCWPAAAFSIILGLSVIDLFYGRPWRSWLVVGGSIPLIAGYTLLVGKLWGMSIPAFFLKKIAFISVIGAVVFGLLFSWRLHANAFSRPKADERNRPIITALRSLEPGVVLAPPDFAGVITLYTNHKVYWGAGYAYKFSGSDIEYQKRWLDTVRLYPESAELTDLDCAGAAGKGGATAVPVSLFEETLIRVLFTSWYNRLFVIPETKFDAACASLKQELENMPLGTAWRPAYRMDYAIFEKGKNGVPTAVARDFKFLDNFGEFSIYKFRQK